MCVQKKCWILTSKNLAKLKQYFHAEYLEVRYSPEYLSTIIDMGIGQSAQEYIKIHQKWRKQVAATALFQFHNEDSWQFSHPCNTISLVLITICAKGMQTCHRRQERETKFNIYANIDEPSFQVVGFVTLFHRSYRLRKWDWKPLTWAIDAHTSALRTPCYSSCPWKWSHLLKETTNPQHTSQDIARTKWSTMLSTPQYTSVTVELY